MGTIKRSEFFKLKLRLLEQGVTQQDLAENIGISLNTLNHKLNSTRPFSLTEVRRICEFLGIDDPRPYFFNQESRNTK